MVYNMVNQIECHSFVKLALHYYAQDILDSLFCFYKMDFSSLKCGTAPPQVKPPFNLHLLVFNGLVLHG